MPDRQQDGGNGDPETIAGLLHDVPQDRSGAELFIGYIGEGQRGKTAEEYRAAHSTDQEQPGSHADGGSNAKARQELGWRPAYPTYREGLAAILRDE